MSDTEHPGAQLVAVDKIRDAAFKVIALSMMEAEGIEGPPNGIAGTILQCAFLMHAKMSNVRDVQVGEMVRRALGVAWPKLGPPEELAALFNEFCRKAALEYLGQEGAKA